MKKLIGLMAALSIELVAGCSNNTPNDPVSLCNTAVTDGCQLFFRCYPTNYFSSTEACISSYKDDLSCSLLKCAPGYSFNTAVVQPCLDAVNAMPCSSFDPATGIANDIPYTECFMNSCH